MGIGRMGLVAAVAAAALSGCGEDVLKEEDVERDAKRVLTEQVGEEPKRIDCPGDLEAKKGETMKCTLVASDDSEVDVTVTVTEVADGKAKYDVEVGQEVRTN